MDSLNVKKVFLYLLVCSVALSALMGIWAIISGEFGELQTRILLTTLTVVTASIFGLACGSFLENPRTAGSPFKIVPAAGIIFSLLGAVSSFLLIWEIYHFDDKGIFKVFFISLLFAFSLSQLSLLSIARLAPRFQWSLVTAYMVILLLDSIIALIILAELDGSSDFVPRIIGILSVIAASLTVMIPIFHRLSRVDFAATEITAASEIDAEIAKLRARIEFLEKQKQTASNAETNYHEDL